MRKCAALVVALLVVACLQGSTASAAPGGTWTGTWSAAPNGGTGGQNGYAGFTIRNLVHTSIGGERLRVKLSNAFGETPVRFEHTTVGLQRLPGSAAIAPGTLRDVTFGGRRDVTVPAGEEIYSDAVELPIADGAGLFVTTFTPDPGGPVTFHSLGVATSYFATDRTDHAGDLGGAGLPSTTVGWHYVTEVDVERAEGSAGAVVTLGDSITDGFNSTPDANRRWPDLLAARLRESHGGESPIGVLNAGISGNRVLLPGAGVAATARLDRDVLQRAGVHTLIVLEGINDIQQEPHQLDPERIIAGLQEIADRAHAAGLGVLGGTITPFEGWFTYNAEQEAAREGVNRWIRESGVFDAVIDFDAAIRDPANPHRMLPRYDSGDHLHPGDAGYQAMADAIDLTELGEPGWVSPAPPESQGRSLALAVTPERTVAIAGRPASVSLSARALVQAAGTVEGTVTTTFGGARHQQAFTVHSGGRFAQVDLTEEVPVPATTTPGEHRISFTVSLPGGESATAEATLEVKRLGCEQADDACLLDLTAAYDHDSIATGANPGDGNFDGIGWSYAAETLPAAGPVVLAGTPFTFPGGADGSDNTVVARGQTLSLPGVSASGMRVLAAATGGGVDAMGTVTYADGSTAPLRLAFGDWAGGPRAGEDVAVAAPYRYRSDSGRDGPRVNVYARTIPLDPARQVRSLLLPNAPNLKIFAVTLDQHHPAEEPGGEEPGGQQPGGQQPGGEQPGGEQPGGEQPGGEQPGGEQPGGEQPGGEQPGGEQPGGEQPGGEEPGGEQPRGRRPARRHRVSVSVRASASSVRRGRRVTFEVISRNRGDRRLRHVRQCVRLPSRMRVIARHGGRLSGRSLCWTTRSLRPGRRTVERVTLRVDRHARPGRVTIRARVVSRPRGRDSASGSVRVRARR